jgi:hypothetical protein
MGAPLGLVGSFDGSCRPSSPNQLPHRTGNTSPFLVILPVSSTRNNALPPPEVLEELELLELDDEPELLLELEDELELLLDELELDEEELLPHTSTTPPSPDWLLQVSMPIQLWLFS